MTTVAATSETYADLVAEATTRLEAAGVSSPVVDGVLLMLYLLETDRAGFAARARDAAEADIADRYRDLVERRCDRIPLQHLAGSAPFIDFEVAIDSRALVPRPETEILATEAIRAIERHLLEPRSNAEKLRIVDLCTGSGVVAIALARRFVHAEIYATDISEDALELAAENLAGLGLTSNVRLGAGDLFAPLPPAIAGEVDLIAANPPYIPSSQIDGLSPEVALHDPRVALDGGPDGLALITRILSTAGEWLAPGGVCVVEIGVDQASVAADIARNSGLLPRAPIGDLAGLPRVLIAARADVGVQ